MNKNLKSPLTPIINFLFLVSFVFSAAIFAAEPGEETLKSRIVSTVEANQDAIKEFVMSANQALSTAFSALMKGDHEKFLANVGPKLKEKYKDKKDFNNLAKDLATSNEQTAGTQIMLSLDMAPKNEDTELVQLSVVVVYYTMDVKTQQKYVYAVAVAKNLELSLNAGEADILKALKESTAEIADWQKQQIKETDPGEGSDKDGAIQGGQKVTSPSLQFRSIPRRRVIDGTRFDEA